VGLTVTVLLLAAAALTCLGVAIGVALSRRERRSATSAADLAGLARTLTGADGTLGVGRLIVFAPTPEVIYPSGQPAVRIDPGPIATVLEGRTRPTHFAGVCQVVLTLMHLTAPRWALFGRKDAQQLAIIESMVRDLAVPLEIVPVDIRRESDGLAMSSRNAYLSPEQRHQALALSRALQAGRDAAEIRLLPVSKTVSEERLRTAFAAGITQMGENKVQEAQRKSENLADLGISWSVIGHLQTNKAKNVAAFADEFQALDSLRLAEALDRRLQAAGRSLDVYVQVNSSGEPSKFGLEPDDVADFLTALPAYSSLQVRGLMTLAANTSEEARVRECFRIMRRLRDAALQAGTVGDGLLSMGMSGDFEAAIEGGSTCVRVGQAIFGARATPDSHYWPETPQNA